MGEKFITTFYEDYGYIPIGVHIKKKTEDYYYIPKKPDEFFIGNGKELYTGCIDFTFTEYSSAIDSKKIQEYVIAIKTLREYIMGLPFDMCYFNSTETKTDKLKAIQKLIAQKNLESHSNFSKITKIQMILNEFKLMLTDVNTIEKLQLFNKINTIPIKYDYLFQDIKLLNDVNALQKLTDEKKFYKIKECIKVIIECLNKNYTMEEINNKFPKYEEYVKPLEITPKPDFIENAENLSIITNELEKRSCITQTQYDKISIELQNPIPNYTSVLNELKNNTLEQKELLSNLTETETARKREILFKFTSKISITYKRYNFQLEKLTSYIEDQYKFREYFLFFNLNKSEGEYIVSLREITIRYMYFYNLFLKVYSDVDSIKSQEEQDLLGFLYEFIFYYLNSRLGLNMGSDIPEFEYLYETTLPSLVRYKGSNFNFGKYETPTETLTIEKVEKKFNNHTLSLNLKDPSLSHLNCLRLKLKVSNEQLVSSGGGISNEIKTIQQYGGAMITPSKLINSFNQLGMDFMVTPSKKYLKRMESIVISSASTLIGYVYKKFTASVKSLLDIKVNSSIMYLFRDLKDDDELNSLLNRLRGEYRRYYRKGFKELYTEYKNYELLDDLYNEDHLSLYKDKFTKRFLEKYIDIYEYDKVLRYEKKEHHLKDLEHMKEFIMFLKVRIKKL